MTNLQENYYCNFTIVGEIMTKQRPRATVIGGHARVYTPSTTINYENYIKSEYQRQNGIDFKDAPINVEIVAHFRPSEITRKIVDGKYGSLLACTKHKDLDNICKIVLDALNGIAYSDDKNIIRLVASKFYTLEQERIEVRIMKNVAFADADVIKQWRLYDKKKEKLQSLFDKEKKTKKDIGMIEKLKEEIMSFNK